MTSPWVDNEFLNAALMYARTTQLTTDHETRITDLETGADTHRFAGRQTVSQSLTTGVWADITMDVEDRDTGNGHSTSSNTGRYVAPATGDYLCGGSVGFGNSTTNARGARWAVNGTAINGGAVLVPTRSTGLGSCYIAAPAKLVRLTVGDYITLQGMQDSGGALSTFVTAEGQSSMSVVLVGG